MNISGGISGETSGKIFQRRVTNGKILPLVGIYDAFSAKLVAQRFEGVFCSGFGFSASNYGLPDVGYVGWREISDFALRVRPLLPHHHLLVDIDDGFGDPTICKSVVERMESIGVSAVMFEDQKRPRRCGHYEGKEILPVEAYLEKLVADGTIRRQATFNNSGWMYGENV
jgi:2-methylisocitrate lyase-like PEP mutase family enzyme